MHIWRTGKSRTWGIYVFGSCGFRDVVKCTIPEFRITRISELGTSGMCEARILANQNFGKLRIWNSAQLDNRNSENRASGNHEFEKYAEHVPKMSKRHPNLRPPCNKGPQILFGLGLRLTSVFVRSWLGGGAYSVGMVQIPSGWCTFRRDGAFSVEMVHIPSGWCVFRRSSRLISRLIS